MKYIDKNYFFNKSNEKNDLKTVSKKETVLNHNFIQINDRDIYLLINNSKNG